MGYIINKLKIENFKYIPSCKPIEIEFEQSNLVVLNGQNGYGKTTLFDAIELLLLGKVTHLAQVQNRGTIGVKDLANCSDHNIIVEAEVSDKEEFHTISRIFVASNEFIDVIRFDNEIISQRQLNDYFKISENLVRMGIYLSQNNSLDFIQNKYKDRKSMIASLVENPVVEEKIEFINFVSKSLKKKCDLARDARIKELTKVDRELVVLRNEIDAVQLHNDSTYEYKKLFGGEFLFDQEVIDTSISYASMIEPLIQLKEYIANYKDYKIISKNAILNELKNFNKSLYVRCYYSKFIDELLKNRDVMQFVEKCHIYLNDFSEEKMYVDTMLFAALNISNEKTAEIENLIKEIDYQKANMSALNASIQEILDARKALIRRYSSAITYGHIIACKCPLCNTDLSDETKSFENAEKRLLELMEANSNSVLDKRKKLKDIILSDVVPAINDFIKVYSDTYNDYVLLKGYLFLDAKELSLVLKSLNIIFEVPNEIKVDLAEFEIKYSEVIDLIERMKGVPSKELSPETFELYKNIETTYYNNQVPSHTVDAISEKIQYIAKAYSSKLNNQLGDLLIKKAELQDSHASITKKEEKICDDIEVIKKKYTNARKVYQTKLVNSLRLPVLIYSGRIIQNYPLGLGIDMKVGDNQVVFFAHGKDDIDAYNILSTGQLNGLAISILLAVNKVFMNKEGLDMILIDDPLQTIDEISAISLADLLINDSVGQIVLSTHEEQKANMLAYKFHQRGLSVLSKNMKEIYLKSKMNSSIDRY